MKWEYRIEHRPFADDEETYLNDMGAQRWELITFAGTDIGTRYWFKRTVLPLDFSTRPLPSVAGLGPPPGGYSRLV